MSRRPLPLLRATLLLGGLLLTACHKVPAMTDAEQLALQPYISQLQPRCLGRYLIDLPSQMRYGLADNMRTVINDATISVKPISQALFEANLKQRLAYLKQLTIIDNHSQNGLDLVVPIQGGMVFDRVEDDKYPTSRVGRTIELWGWKAGYFIKIETKAVNISYFTDPNDREGLKSDVAEKLVYLQRMYSRIRGRSFDEVPTEPGLCFYNGFFASPGEEREEMWLTLVTRGIDDVILLFETNPEGSDSVLQYLPGESANLALQAKEKNASYQLLRSGKRQSTAGIPFEEALHAGPTRETDQLFGAGQALQGHKMLLRAYFDHPTPAQPYVQLTLRNGQRQGDQRGTMEQADHPWPALKKASLSDAQSVALWDAITATLRLRPTQPGSGTMAPLGDVAALPPAPPDPSQYPQLLRCRSGERCPQAGYWLVVRPREGSPLVLSRHFAEAETFPQALLQHESTG